MRLKRECEKTKIELSSISESTIYIDSLAKGIDFSLNIYRSKFEFICEELFEKYILPITQALEDVNLDKKEIDDVILVGSSSSILKIQDIVQKYFEGKILNKNVNPEVVVEGAVIQVVILKRY